MAKNKRKKKQRQEDFKKVKLKVGRKLPPAQNATETQFKSRAIVLPSQLVGQSSGEPTNNRRQNLKDLISQVNHYNATVRQDALVGLRNLFQNHPNTLDENLGVVVERVIDKVTDTDGTVRQSLLLLLRYIFPLVTPEKMAPFTPLIVAHLSCAMTHIHEEIQLDSLNFLGLCLQYFSIFMVDNSAMLLPNFINLISRQSLAPTLKSRTKGKPMIASEDTHLNPRGKMPLQKSKFQVLTQLLEFLKAIQVVSSDRMGMLDDNVGTWDLVSVSESSIKHTEPLVIFDDSRPTHVQVYQHSVTEPCLKPELQLNLNLSTPGISPCNKITSLSSLSDVKKFIQLILPTLLECWMECNPAQMVSGLLENTSSQLALSIMIVIARVIKLLFTLLKAKHFMVAQSIFNDNEVEWLRENYFKDFKQHFIAFFPFATSSTVKEKGKKKGKKKETRLCKDSHCESTTLNVLICEIMSVFVNTQSFQGSKPDTWIIKLVEFTSEILESKSRGSVATQLLELEGIQGLLLFVQQILSSAQWMEGDCNEVVDNLFTGIFHLYQSSHLMSSVKKILLKFFSQTILARDQKCRNQPLPIIIEKWLNTLPRLLLQLGKSSSEMTDLAISVIKQSIKQQLIEVNSNVQQSLTDFFDQSKGPFIALEESTQRSSVELLFVLPVIDDALLKVLVECCHKGTITLSVVEYLMQILFYRSPCYSLCLALPPAMNLPVYLSFMFSLALGYSRDELNKYQDIANVDRTRTLQFGTCEVVIVEVDMERWSYHEGLVKMVCRCYKQLNCSDNLLLYMGGAVRTFMDNTKVFPVIAANSLLMVVQSWMDLSPMLSGGSCQINVDFLQSAKFPLALLAKLVVASLLVFTEDSSIRENDLLSASHGNARSSLGSQALQMLLLIPPLAEQILSILQLELPACTTSKLLSKDIAAITRKLLSVSDLRSMFVPVASEMELIVETILTCDQLQGTQTVHDLSYVYSLFQLDVKRAGCAKS